MCRRFRLIAFFFSWVGVIAGAGAGEPVLEGKLVQGGLVQGVVDPGARVELAGKSVPVDDEGRFVIGFDRDAPAVEQLHVDGQVFTLSIEPREYDIQRVEGIAKRIMSPSEQDLQRISKEAAQVANARTLYDLRADFATGFEWPVVGPISGVYGSQRFYNGNPSRPHYGVDIAVATGTPVLAPAPGLVTLAEDDLFYSGGTVIVDHGHGLTSSFLHMSKVSVAVGQRVDRGTMIGEVGATGRVTGPHLDWRMNWRDRRIDPQLLVGEMIDANAVAD